MRILATIALLLSLQPAFGQTEFVMDDSVDQRIVLVGDAGDPGSVAKGQAVVIDAIKKTIPMTKNTLVLFMGDNLYENGLPCVGDVCYQPGVNALDTQASVVLNTPAHAIFLPGNHDWANGKPDGYDNILRQGAYLNNLADNVKFYPEDGCPGPVELPLGKNAVLVIMDSQWWLLRGDKPGYESDCKNKSEEEILDDLKDIVTHNANKLVIFACHHPFKSTGVHSGYYGIKQHIFPFTDLNKNLYIPLPIIGSIYPISRGVFGSPQDMKFPMYAHMIAVVEDVLKTHPYVVHVSGHDHNLQLINDSSYHYIVSGGGCKAQRVGHNKKTKFAAQSMGFAVMDISKNKNVRVTFYEVQPKTGVIKQAYSNDILNFSKLPPIAKDTVTVHELVYKDSAIAAPNKHYAKASGFKRLMLGDNYRTEWATDVKFKVFNINKEKGGLTIEGMGGGKQTRSLHLKDSSGKKWALRTLNKDPQKAIPENIRNTFAADIVQDMISANYPYSALPVPVLASALGVTHATAEYMVVPDDYALGYYRPAFANTVCMLEEQDPAQDSGGGKSTSKMFNKMRDKDNHTIDQTTLLKARLLDFLIADYDRHYDQWKWGTRDSGKEKIFYPIPHDRDEAYFYSDGLVMKYATWQRLPFLKGFRYDMPRMRWQGYVARYFDRDYLNELNADDWKRTAAEFKNDLSDSVIIASVKTLPPEVRGMDSSKFVGKMESRRDLMPEKAMVYYKFISKRVNILGSNEDEYFHLSKYGDGITVNVYAKNKEGDTTKRIYSRSFNPKVTKELRLYGFNGDDVFKVDDDVRSKIKVRIIGGQGDDTFNINGHVQNFIYDFKKENNVVLADNKTRDRMSDDPTVNNYNDKEENYTTWRFPHLELGYNEEDKFLVGFGILQRTYNFRKKPYSTDQKLTTLFSPSNNAYQLRYSGEFRDLFHATDLVVAGQYIKPTLTNFFGFGNETVKKSGSGLYAYQVRYEDLDGSILVRKRYFNNLLSIGIGPSFYQYNWASNYNTRTDRVIANPANLGLDSNSIYHKKSYAGGIAVINVNNLNAELLPTRGIDWTTSFTAMQGLNANSNPITKLTSNMSVYASIAGWQNIVALLRLGGGHIFSQHYEYFQALTLGDNNYLRGYLKDRFSGSSLAYADIELRIKVCDVRSYIMPGTFGVIGFNDAGRVWVKNETSNTWHDAYGAGLYYTPFNTVIVSVTTALSGENALFNFTLGTKVNLTF